MINHILMGMQNGGTLVRPTRIRDWNSFRLTLVPPVTAAFVRWVW